MFIRFTELLNRPYLMPFEQGGGEAGAEAVLPLSQLGSMITEGMTAAMGGAGDTVINVSIDNNSLGSVILTAQQMMNLRRGR